MLQIIDPATRLPFPSATVAGRKCYAVPFGAEFAVLVEPPTSGEVEAVIAVDGRDVLANVPASPSHSGVVIIGAYMCPGFQVGAAGAAAFVHAPQGRGLTTAERNGAPDACGLAAVVMFGRNGRRRDYGHALEAASFGPTRSGGVTRSSGGAMAGRDVANRLGETTWERGASVGEEVVEYDTREGWAARGVVIPEINRASPWPGAAPRFAARAGL